MSVLRCVLCVAGCCRCLVFGVWVFVRCCCLLLLCGGGRLFCVVG